RMPFTVLLLAPLLQLLLKPGHALLAATVKRGEALTLLLNSFRRLFPNEPVLLIQCGTMVVIVALDDSDFFRRERRNPAPNLFMGAAPLEIGHQILHGDTASRKLKPPAAIYQSDFSHDLFLSGHEKRHGLLIIDFVPARHPCCAAPSPDEGFPCCFPGSND